MTSGKLVALGLIGIAVAVFAGLMLRTYQSIPGDTIVLLDTETGRYATNACVTAGSIDPDFHVPDADQGIEQIDGRTIRTTYAAIREQTAEDETLLPDEACRNAGGFLEERTLFTGRYDG
ncbi:MAG: hypothetical protein AAFX39_08930 [Pseudomonadota bacterium]